MNRGGRVRGTPGTTLRPHLTSGVSSGHPEGYLDAFAIIYRGVAEAIRARLDGAPLEIADYAFPTVYDGLRGMQFIDAAYRSNKAGSVWMNVE